MEQKFVNFEDAVEKLGISPEQLNELRERGQLRAYRDGSSWKFRGEEIQRMAQEGIPEPPPPSDIGLADFDELIEAAPLDVDEEDTELKLVGEDEPSTSPSDSAADLTIDSELDTDALSFGSELELDLEDQDQEDTVTTDASDVLLERPEEPSDPSDSILLSEEALGESSVSSPSTIIGRDKLDEDADLELVSEDDVAHDGSDVRLEAGVSDVLSSQIAGSGVLDEAGSAPGDPAAFEDIEELELDLAAESSRILNPEDLSAVQSAAKQLVDSKDDNDLRLGSDSDLAGEEAETGSTDVPAVELEAESGEGSGSELELADEDDLVLADSEGSDITLDSGDSGINLSPADSGLALDDIPLDLGGSAILSSLSLGGESSDPELSLVAGDSDLPMGSMAELKAEEDFKLTPLGEGAEEDEGDSSSQVIALDAEISGLGEGASMLDSAFAEEGGEAVVLSEDFGQEENVSSLGVADFSAAPSVAAGSESTYTVGNIILLGSCFVLLGTCSLMMFDMVMNIWSWDEPYALNSSILDALSELLKL